MTRGEAIAKLKIDRDYLCKMSSMFDANEVAKPFNMAIRNLEAWDKVKQGIAEYLEEYGYTDANGNHCEKWCAMKEAEALINKHLKEVEDESR